eukprot:59930-Chlamydomonas_euryale.AAC.3
METGEVVSGAAAAAAALVRGAASSGDAVTAAAARAIADAEQEEMRQKRLAKKASFDSSVSTARWRLSRCGWYRWPVTSRASPLWH